ncbi:MAG: DUF5788 family protein [Halodesulfurarchaeum sp.]
MQDYERAQLLERIEREGSTVGVSIPDRLSIGEDEAIDLAAFVFEVRRGDGPAESRVREVIRDLRAERRRRRAKIESGEISREAGERLAEAIQGIDRALNALETADEEVDLEAATRRRRRADRKRWMSFIESVTGEEFQSKGGHDRSGRENSP